MKVISPLFSSMSGKLGGSVAAKARGGVQYLRSLVIPGNPRSTQQTSQRLYLAAAAAAWRGLTDSQRAAWTAIAAPTMSGIDAFTASASYLGLMGIAPFTAAPASLSNPYAVGIPAVIADASDHTIDIDGIEFGDARDALIFVSRPQHASRGARQFSYRYAGVITDAGDPVVLPTSHPAYAMQAGQIVYVRVVQLNIMDGSFSTPQELRTVVQA